MSLVQWWNFPAVPGLKEEGQDQVSSEQVEGRRRRRRRRREGRQQEVTMTVDQLVS